MRYLRIRAEDGTPLCEITDAGHEVMTREPARLLLVIANLADHVRHFHEAASGSPSQLAAENQRLRDRIAELEAEHAA